MPTPLHDLLAASEGLRDALLAGDMDAILGFVAERTACIDRLRPYPHPSDVTPEWQALGRATQALETEVRALLEEHLQAYEARLQQTDRSRQAHRAYGFPPISGGQLTSVSV